MAPPRWTCPEQYAFLVEYLPMFLEYMATNKQSKFWALLNSAWNYSPPKPPARMTARVGSNISSPQSNSNDTKRRWRRVKQLQAWMRNERKKRLGAANVSSTRKTSALSRTGSSVRKRLHQEEEVYEALYKEKLQALYEEEFTKQPIESDDSGSDSGTENSKQARLKDQRSKRMKIRREVRTKAWAMEADDVKERVRNKLEEERREMEELELGEEEGLARTPTQRQNAIEKQVELLRQTCATINRLSGWSTVVLTGGLNPSLKNEKVSIQTVSFGTTSAGSTFPDSYPRWDLDLVQPFLSWLKTVYDDPLKRASIQTDRSTESAPNNNHAPLDVSTLSTIPEEDPFAVNDSITPDLDALPTNEDLEPAYSSPSPPIATDNHLQGDGGPSQPLWMAFGGRPPTPPPPPTIVPNVQEVPQFPIDPALMNTIPEPTTNARPHAAHSSDNSLPNTPISVESQTGEQPHSSAAAIPPSIPPSQEDSQSGVQPTPSSVSQTTTAASLPTVSSPPPVSEETMDVQMRPYIAPKIQRTVSNPPGCSRGGRGCSGGRGGRQRSGGRGGRQRGGRRGGRQRGGSRVVGEGVGENDENVPAGGPNVTQVQPFTAAQRRKADAYNNMLKNVTPNLDGLYPLANFGPPPTDSVPAVGTKRSRKASKLSDGTAAYLVPSAEELEKAEEVRKQKAAQRALKRGGNMLDTGRGAKRYVEKHALFVVPNVSISSAPKPVE
ncbi:hypothetical protein M413DRAFT_9431 [Hebeloma cylindrosporum]|uniref:Uncharacterized protein n=1 Tax=Hebeloma cylindrosporum TaxID=76867 RepID=A0A0C2Y365_HEBCY|nr:hypothetical protein M413DRAFT_9431 [Hebeloma cylindrosporum h7]